MELRLIRRFAAAALAGLVLPAAADDLMDVRATGDAIVANRDVNTEGIVFGLAAPEVKALIDAQMRFRRAHEEQIAKIADSLELDRCAVAEELRKLALLGASHEVPDPAADSSGTKSTAATDDGPDALPHVERTGSVGDADQARTLLVSIGRGVVAGRDVNVAGDVVFGIRKAEFTALIDELRQQDLAYADKMRVLSADLHVNRCATTSFLATLGDNDVPVEQLHSRLIQIARDHMKLIAQWASVTESDAEITRLRARAKTSIVNGEYARADELLTEASEKMRTKVGHTSAVRGDFAKVAADRGRLALVRMQYADAVEAFGEARRYAMTADATREAIHYLELMAGAYQDAGNYRKAEDAFQDALEELEDNAPDDLLRMATYLNNLGTLLFARSKYSEAAERFAEARDAMQDSADLDPRARALQLAVSLNGLGDAATARSLFDEAEDFYLRGLGTMVDALGPDDHRLLNLLTNLARLKSDRGKFDEAEKLYEQALALDREGRSINAPELAATKSNFAALYFDRGDMERAEGLWQEAFDVYSAALGGDHIITLGVLMNLGNVYRTKGRLYRKTEDLCLSEEIYLRALGVWDRNSKRRKGRKLTVDADHLLVASIHRSLAHVYVNQDKLHKAEKGDVGCKPGKTVEQDTRDKLEEAEKHYEKARRIARDRFEDMAMDPLEQPLYMGLTNDLAVLGERRGDYEKAVKEFGDARKLFERKFGETHPNYGIVTSNLARVYRRMGRLDDSKVLYLAAIRIAEANGDRLKVAYRQKSLAMVQRDLGRLDEARRSLETARAIYIEELGEGHQKTLKVIELLDELETEPT